METNATCVGGKTDDYNLEGVVVVFAALSLTTLGFFAHHCSALKGHGDLGLQQVSSWKQCPDIHLSIACYNQCGHSSLCPCKIVRMFRRPVRGGFK